MQSSSDLGGYDLLARKKKWQCSNVRVLKWDTDAWKKKKLHKKQNETNKPFKNVPSYAQQPNTCSSLLLMFSLVSRASIFFAFPSLHQSNTDLLVSLWSEIKSQTFWEFNRRVSVVFKPRVKLLECPRCVIASSLTTTNLVYNYIRPNSPLKVGLKWPSMKGHCDQ